MKAKVLPPSPEHLHVLANTLIASNIVAIPTETVYGLAGNCFNEEAILKIFSTKNRPQFDPLIVHISNKTPRTLEGLLQLNLINFQTLSTSAQVKAEELMQKYWPGPLTLVLPKHHLVPDLVTSGLSTVAIRMPEHPVAQMLLQQLPFPLAAPSANAFGRISPTSAQDVLEELGDKIDFILDGGPCSIGIESTVVHIDTTGSLTILRPGGINLVDFTKTQTINTPKFLVNNEPTHQKPGESPGMLKSHYAPRKKLILLSSLYKDLSDSKKETLLALINDLQPGFLFFQTPSTTFHVAIKEVLSPTGDLSEAAKNLFAKLRALDNSEAQILIAESCRNQDLEFSHLSDAINDRLIRASSLTL